MLFNSFDFAIFLPIVFILYWFVFQRNLRLQNAFLVVASYVFYGWWDWRFLSLIFFSSLVDFLVGIGLAREERPSARRLLLLASIVTNLGLLGFFKYYNFFLDNFEAAFRLFGQPLDARPLQVILPVGISFYTFQTMSYSIDVFRRKMEPTRDPVAFFAYVSFFPQLVAGPIERASNLLPQFFRTRVFDEERATDGARQILWGFFKKVVIADNCALYVNDIFANHAHYSGSTLVLGVILFAFQIYGDFSGYSDIAIGTARLFGFSLMRNFAYPYFSRDIAEFWRRWHISLSSWFRDYLYIPLGGSRGGLKMKIRNVIAIFVVSGFWHGANWTFIIWGLLNGLYYLPLMLWGKNREFVGSVVAEGRLLPNLRELFQMGTTFGLTLVAWVFFRAQSLGDALSYLGGMASRTLWAAPSVEIKPQVWCFVLFLVVVEWFQREREHGLDFHGRHIPRGVRWAIYYLVVFLTVAFGGDQQQFIYFQF